MLLRSINVLIKKAGKNVGLFVFNTAGLGGSLHESFEIYPQFGDIVIGVDIQRFVPTIQALAKATGGKYRNSKGF